MTSDRPIGASGICLAGVALVAAAVALPSVRGLAAREPQAADAPADLRPLLAPRQSDLSLVALRYALDRQTLDRNYAGSPDRLAGTAADPGPNQERVPLSRARLSRLKRFDLDWQQAIGRLDTAGISPASRAGLGTLETEIAANLRAIEDEARTIVALEPLLPFAPALVDLIEARIRIAGVDPQRAASVLSASLPQIAGARSSLASAGVPRDLAARGAAAVSGLRRDLDEWFAFYDGYDPLFTWWVPMPYRSVREALDAYANWLRNGVPEKSAALKPVAPIVDPEPPRDDVPDLAELVRLPQDELVEIVRRFRAGHEGGRAGGAAASPEFYRRWLAALQTLDFATLSRNAQIDYLFIKRTARIRIDRASETLPANPPRKPDASGIPGNARGRLGLIRDLVDEMIPYTAEELVVLAEREFAWVEREMIRASRELGFGDDWKRAIEHVKGMHPPPGGQPAVVRDLLQEAVGYLRTHGLLTVPQVAAESQHMVMLTPAQQLINPFFRGGPRISVSYPTPAMTFDQRLQSMRGNNTPFSHATAHHEMIPGHYLDDFTRARFASYRAELVPRTPFFREGWALYWELRLYERGFHDTPEERIGALFWLMHRCARIVFSLRFHLGQWSPQEAIDYLVDRVGHERDNATAEVRRSFEGTYPPLYQAAYLLGGLQLRALQRELVGSGRLTERAFHDEALRQNAMPIALLRLAVGGQPLTPETSMDWRFYGDVKSGTPKPGS
jgi:hypothetical protein